MTQERAHVNTVASTKGGLGGLLAYWYFYVDMVLNWDISAILTAQNLEEFITGSFVAFTGVGAIAGWNRDRPSPAPTSPVDIDLGQAPVKKNWFSRSEMDCKGINCPNDCQFIAMSPTTLAIANDAREQFGAIVCNSGYRCETHNASIPGAAKNSLHKYSRAMDLKPADTTPAQLYKYLTDKYPDQYGFGLYKTFVHIDDREIPARKAGPDLEWTSK